MRKSVHQETTNHHQLILNYKQEESIQVQMLLPIWTKTWVKFELDILSYIVPAIQQPAGGMVDESAVNLQLPPANKPKHAFSFAYSSRELKKVIAIHSHMDVFVEVRKQITRIFYKIANAYVNHCFQADCEDISTVFVEVYRKIQPKLAVLIGCLNLVLNKFITRRGIEEQIYSIINKELVNHHRYETYVNSCIASIESLRNYCLQINQVCPDLNNPQYPSITHPKIQHAKILSKLKIFPYVDYIERSKKYYSDLLPQIPKNIWMFPVVFNLIKCQKLLENTITPDPEQIQCVKKLLKSEGWRALEQQTMIKVFCKEVLDEIYDDMIEYVDYLLDFETNFGDQNEGGTRTNYILNLQEKKDVLKYLWQMAKILQKNYTNEKQKYMGNIKFSNVNSLERKNLQNMNPGAKLLNRITMIITDLKKHIILSQNQKSKGNTMYKIIYFRDHIFSIVSQCFFNDSKFLNAITSKIEQVIVHEEQAYNSKLCQIILSPKYKFPGIVNETAKLLSNYHTQMTEESEESVDINNKCSFQLFKLTPSKEQFIRKFEQQFSNYVIPSWDRQLNLTEQQNFIRPIQGESGYSLSRNIERMITDVWRNGEIVFYKHGKILCRVLNQDWPHPAEAKYKLADKLIQIRTYFEAFFLSEPENDKRKLKWIQQYGRVFINISGIQCSFSELQASIIVLLSKSYRPIKSSQFKEVLQYQDDDMQAVLNELATQNVLIFNRDSKSYELNFDNTVPYSFESKQKESKKNQKKGTEKDYVVVVQAYIARILKRRKSVQKTDIAKILTQELKVGFHQPTIEEINTALERLAVKEVITIEKTRGIIRYLQ